MKFQSLGCVVFAFAGLASGCAPSTEHDSLKSTASYYRNVKYQNGPNLNGVNLNSARYHSNGVNFNGVNLNGVNLNGVNLNDVYLDAGDLHGTRNSVLKHGDEMISAQVTANTSDGDVPMVITNVIVDVQTDPPHRLEPNLYFISTVELDGQGEPIMLTADPVCKDDSDPPVALPAVLISEGWNNSTGARTGGTSGVVTLACVNGAIGKCAMWGYVPWSEQEECFDQQTCTNRSLADWHQSCTRMVRADYCGDGAYHTQTGTSINVWDNFDIQQHGTPGMTYTAEAEWTQSGARCIKKTRWAHAGTQPTGTDYEYVRGVCPERLAVYDRHCTTGGTCSGAGGDSTSCTTDADCNCNVLACPNTSLFTCNTGSGHCESNDNCGSTDFSSASDFTTAVGYSIPTTNSTALTDRRVMRNESQ